MTIIAEHKLVARAHPPRTKKTSQQIAVKKSTGKPFIVSAHDHRKWAKLVAAELREQWGGRAPLEGPLEVAALFYRERATGDLSGFVQAVGDVLQAPHPRSKPNAAKMRAAVIRDDKQIDSWDGSRRLIDREDPRVEITIRELEPEAVPERKKRAKQRQVRPSLSL